MGQRLVLSVKALGKEGTLVNVYMHWAAYTGSAIEVTDQFIRAYKNWAKLNPTEKRIFGETDKDAIARQKEIIAMLMMDCWKGALPGFENIEDASTIKLHLLTNGMLDLAMRLPDTLEHDRNAGLIGVTESAINYYQSNSEGDVEVFIDEDGDIREIYFGIVWSSEWSEACEEYADDDELGTKEQQLLKDLYETDFVDNDRSNFSLEEWDEFKDICNIAWDEGKEKIGSKKNNSVWSFIG